MSRMFPSAPAILLVLAAVSCTNSPAPADTTADKAAIDKLRADYTAAYNAGDTDKLGALYASDIILMESNQVPASGKDAVLTRVKTNLSQAALNMSLTSEETKISGDMAYDRGMYMLTITPKAQGAPPMMEHGKYLVVLMKQADGSWKLTREIGNSNDPAPPPPAPAAAKPGAKKK